MEVEKLFKRAWDRFKDRFLNFLIVTVLGWALGIAIVLGVLISVGVVFLVWVLLKAQIAVAIAGVIMGIASVALLVYLSSWAQLAIIEALIQTKRVTPFETFKKVKPFVKDYVVFILLLMLFFIGLFPFTLLSLFIVGLLWSLWSSFSVFIFLEKRKKGLENLWISRDMVNQKFWPIAGLAFVVFIVIILVSTLFISAKNGFLSSAVTQLFITPLVTCFYYEMYKSLKVPQQGKKPRVWIGLSVVGFALLVVVMVVSVQALQKAIPEFMKKNSPEKRPFYKELLYPSPSATI